VGFFGFVKKKRGGKKGQLFASGFVGVWGGGGGLASCVKVLIGIQITDDQIIVSPTPHTPKYHIPNIHLSTKYFDTSTLLLWDTLKSY